MTKLSTLCYIEKDGRYLILHRTVKKNDVNKDKWIGVGAVSYTHLDVYKRQVLCLASIFVSPELGEKELYQIFSAAKEQGILVCADMTKPKKGDHFFFHHLAITSCMLWFSIISYFFASVNIIYNFFVFFFCFLYFLHTFFYLRKIVQYFLCIFCTIIFLLYWYICTLFS